MSEEDSSTRPHSSSIDSSYDGDPLYTYEDEDSAAGVLSDSDPNDNDAEDFAYYQDVYRFVGAMKNEFEKRAAMTVDWDTIQRKKEEVKEDLLKRKDAMKEAVITSKERLITSKDRLTEKSKEKLASGRKRILKLRKKTYKRLKRLEPDENYRMKLVFTKSVITLVLKTFAVCSGQWLLPWYYALTCPTLIIWRIITYWKAQFQYFCLDYCYFGNLIISLILWFAPSSPELCSLQFSIANGMLFLGSFSFRNSLVFHSNDKMTSTYIHTVPIILTFGIRWFPEETGRFWYSGFPTEPLEPSWTLNVLGPLVVLLTHSVLYTLLVHVILRPEEHIVTSFRYLKAKKSVKKVFGPNPPYIVFLVTNWLSCIVFSAMTMVMYKYYWAHVLAIIILFVYVVWNGAGYYFDVFRMSMVTAQGGIKGKSEKEE